jgi:hypothetical protein
MAVASAAVTAGLALGPLTVPALASPALTADAGPASLADAADAGPALSASPADAALALAAARPAARPATRSAAASATGLTPAKKRKATITYLRNVSHSASGVAFSVRKPQLKGSTTINQLAFMYKVENAITEEIARQARTAGKCSKSMTAKVTGTTRGAVARGRYASVAMIFRGNKCGGGRYTSVRSFTLDLKRGVFVTLSKVAPLTGKHLKWAQIDALYKTSAYKAGRLGGKNVTLVTPDNARSAVRNWEPLPKLRGWRLHAKGGDFYFFDSRGGLVTITLSWQALQGKAKAVGGHAIAYDQATFPGKAGLVVQVPHEMKAQRRTANSGAWTTPDGTTALSVGVAALPAGQTPAQFLAASAEPITAAGWIVESQQRSGRVLTLTARSADGANRLWLRVTAGAHSSERIAWTYPAAASPWVNRWIRDTAADTRHAPL